MSTFKNPDFVVAGHCSKKPLYPNIYAASNLAPTALFGYVLLERIDLKSYSAGETRRETVLLVLRMCFKGVLNSRCLLHRGNLADDQQVLA